MNAFLPLSQALWLSWRFAWIWSFPVQSQHSALCSFWTAQRSWWLPRPPQTLLHLNRWEDEEVIRTSYHPRRKWRRCYRTCQSYLIFLYFLFQTPNLEIFVTHKFEKTAVYILKLPHLVQQILYLPTCIFFWQKLKELRHLLDCKTIEAVIKGNVHVVSRSQPCGDSPIV